MPARNAARLHATPARANGRNDSATLVPVAAAAVVGGSPAVSLGGLDELVGYGLRRAQLAVFADFVEALADLDLRPGPFSVLVVVDANPGLSQAAVGDALGIQRANFVPLAADLERRGLLARAPSATDRRQNALRLTPDGRRLLRRAWAAVNAHEQRVAGRLGPDGRRELLALLGVVAETQPIPPTRSAAPGRPATPGT
jgi:DNA-binding MarR family transcriptional regulator